MHEGQAWTYRISLAMKSTQTGAIKYYSDHAETKTAAHVTTATENATIGPALPLPLQAKLTSPPNPTHRYPPLPYATDALALPPVRIANDPTRTWYAKCVTNAGHAERILHSDSGANLGELLQTSAANCASSCQSNMLQAPGCIPSLLQADLL